LDWIKELRRIRGVELALVIAGVVVAVAISRLTGISGQLQSLIDHSGRGGSIADYGPGLLFLSCGLGIVAARRWHESDVERRHLDQTQRELRHSEGRYRGLIEVSPDPVLVAVAGKIEYANPAALSFFGVSDPADLLGHDVLDRLPDNERAETTSRVATLMETGAAIEPVQGYLLRLDGTLVAAETALVRMRYEDGYAVQAVVRDLTARHAADEAASRYRALAENSEDLVYFLDPSGNILDCNRAAELQTGFTKAELCSRTVSDLRAPGTDYPTGPQLAMVPGQTVRFDTVHVRKDGTLMEMAVTAQRILLGDEEFVVSICRDVTEAHRSERDLRASEERYRSLIDLSPSPVAVYNAQRRIVFANQATLDLLRARDASDVIGKDVGAFIHRDSLQTAQQGMDRRDHGGESRFIDIRLVRVDGTSVAAQMATSNTRYDGGTAVQAVIQDVSQLMDVAQTLKRTTEDTISAMARLAETRDPYTSGHQERVSAMAQRIAVRLGLPESTCDAVRLAGIVHDIGKMNVPAEILSKPGRLTDAEFEIIKGHAQRGYEVLLPIDFPWPIADIVRQHHERLDGSGYPQGLRDGAIRIEARVLAVADVVEAVSSHRPYRPALGLDRAMDIIVEGRGTLYDAKVVDACLELASESALFEDPSGNRRPRPPDHSISRRPLASSAMQALTTSGS
jgi:PAS domain S-box-containing protein/putative nucleotidyltransferase with HDIG domain